MTRILSRILLISGDMMAGDESLRRRILRFTGSRRATRAILSRIDAERKRDPLMGCMIQSVPPQAECGYGDESGWLLRVSRVMGRDPQGSHA
jgi:hypothetical protein